MKIGILTQPLGTNYGGILQNYALQQVLLQRGYTVLTLDTGLYSWRKWLWNCVKVYIKRLLGRSEKMPISPKAYIKRCVPLRRFVSSHIAVTPSRVKHLNASVIKRYGLECLIVGSDQVWRSIYNSPIQNMYLDFAANIPICKIAYAASFGTSQWEYSEEQQCQCAKYAQKFTAISVREKSGVELCKTYLNVDATWVLDPTLLLQAHDYNKLLTDTQRPTSEAVMFVYMLDLSKEKLAVCKALAQQFGLSLNVVSAGNAIKEEDSVEAWLSKFRDATYVITDSFHGTVFSILNHKNFVVFSNPHRGEERMTSLLELLGLQSRHVRGVQFPSNTLTENIDWEQVDELLEQQRRSSLNFLYKALV